MNLNEWLSSRPLNVNHVKAWTAILDHVEANKSKTLANNISAFNVRLLKERL